MNGLARDRWVAAVLLAAVFAVFGMAAPAPAEAPHPDAAGVHTVALAALPAPGLPNPHNAPDIPLADTDPAAELDPPESPATEQAEAPAAPPRADRQPAADRAPPA